MKNIVIIGNGISGITAARHIRKRSRHRLTVISGETDHFFSRTALMYIFMGHMKYEHTKPYEDWFWEKNNIELIRDFVCSLDTKSKALKLASGKILNYDILIIGTGSTPNKFGWPGQDLKGVQGLYSLPDLENMEVYTKDIRRAAVVGGGLIGVEMAEMLHSRHIPVTILVREKSFWNTVLPDEESAIINRHIQKHGIDLRLETELKEIIPDESGRVKSVITQKGEEIPCQFVGLTVGVCPNIDFLKDPDTTGQSKIHIGQGILVNEYFETNIPEVYAVGDCVQFEKPRPGRKEIEQIWYTGRMHGETVAKTICGNRTAYNPGPWFNSAKFFDIEYQVYGVIKNNPDENTESLYWEHEKGEKSIRIVYDKSTTKLLGINLMGIRYRHEVCDRWLRTGASLRKVMSELSAANFDPEFSSEYEDELLTLYNNTFPDDPVQGRSKRSLISTLLNSFSS